MFFKKPNARVEHADYTRHVLVGIGHALTMVRLKHPSVGVDAGTFVGDTGDGSDHGESLKVREQVLNSHL